LTVPAGREADVSFASLDRERHRLGPFVARLAVGVVS
jgi:hypothetical protein